MFLTLAIALFVGIAFLFEPTTGIQVRPNGVSESAIWAGGADGGHWFEVTNENDGEYGFNIFDDHIGSLISQGSYRLAAGCSPLKTKIQDQISWFDGQDIILENSCHLVPNGWITFGVGFKIKYEMGAQASEKVEVQN